MDKKPDTKTYKNISIYDAEAKKNKSYLIKCNDFNDEKEMMEHIKKLRAEQRIKNELYRKMLKEGKVNRIEQIVVNPTLQLFGNIHIDNNINLKLDPNTGNTTVILGSSKRGKSSIMSYLYNKYYADDKDYISTLFSINAHTFPIKDKLLLKCGTFNAMTEKYIKLEKHINTKTKNKYKFLNMLDDIVDQKHSRLINSMILTYRNSMMSTIMSLQYGFLLNKMSRANVNSVLIFGSNSDESITDLIKTYLKHHFEKLGYKSYQDQLSLFKYVTSDHGFIYLNSIDDKISFHKLNI